MNNGGGEKVGRTEVSRDTMHSKLPIDVSERHAVISSQPSGALYVSVQSISVTQLHESHKMTFGRPERPDVSEDLAGLGASNGKIRPSCTLCFNRSALRLRAWNRWTKHRLETSDEFCRFVCTVA